MAESEIMSLEELDRVAGGNYVEILKDLKLFGAIGLIDKKQVPAKVDCTNFEETNRLAYETWRMIGVNVQGSEGRRNTYTLPSQAASFGSDRQAALAYAKQQSGRGDLDLNSYL